MTAGRASFSSCLGNTLTLRPSSSRYSRFSARTFLRRSRRKFLPPSLRIHRSFAERVITTLADDPYAVVAIDVDGDGDVDALSASKDDDTVAWYENDCSTSPPTSTPAPSFAPSPAPSHAPSAAPTHSRSSGACCSMSRTTRRASAATRATSSAS
jgi:hypothetical protein